jgi:cell wall-associated NlpC family hydrolase
VTTTRTTRRTVLAAVVASAIAVAGATAPAAAVTAAPGPTTTAAAAPIVTTAPAAPTPTAAPDPRATGTRPGFVAKAPGALPRPVISRGVVGDPVAVLAADLLTRAKLGQSGPTVDAVRAQLAALVAARVKSATAVELDAAWARATPARLTVVLTALAQVGVKYAWAQASPASGFDCSGLVLYAWATAGVKLPHNSEDQIAAVRRLAGAAELQAGDITWQPNHVALYLGAGRAVVEAEQTGVPVKVDDWGAAVSAFGSPA